MRRIIGILLILLTLIVSCYVAPAPVFRLQTISDNNEQLWLHGKELIQLTGDDIELIVVFDEVRENIIVFNLEVINHGLESKIISSELFKAYYLDEKMVGLNNNTYHLAINPEDKLLQIDKTLSKENARYANESRDRALSFLFEFVNDVASVGEQKTNEEIEKASQEDIKKELQEINNDNYHTGTIRNHKNEKDLWSFSALRKTTLPSNHSISGNVFFPLIFESHYLKLIFDEEKENLSILFKINKFNPN